MVSKWHVYDVYKECFNQSYRYDLKTSFRSTEPPMNSIIRLQCYYYLINDQHFRLPFRVDVKITFVSDTLVS